MGLLDDLQVRADRVRSDERQRHQNLQLEKDFYEAELKPVMLLAYEHFSKLIENLNLVKPRITASYPLNPENKAGVSLNQTDYEFIFDHGERPVPGEFSLQAATGSWYRPRQCFFHR